MVQRKVSNKLGLQADHLLLKSKPTCFQHQDGKTRGSDMKKKKMKRSKSIKVSDFETFNPHPLKKTISRPEKSQTLASPATETASLQKQKLPTLTSPATEVTPQKQVMIKSGDGSPNYMKATTSSEARKERLRRNSRLSSDRSEKSAKSFKPARTLTKTPTFKPARSAAKKSSMDALCADVDVQKATCSSTLKDSKFPAYLMLNPGGTESEGTSVMKVCPYTYCSLNGHHHAPSPPLKCFLKAKRRSLKNQKSSKMQGFSPRKVKPSCDETEGVTTEVGADFFVEIYASQNNGDIKYSFDGDDEEVADEHENKDQVSENVSDASPQSEVDFEENCVTAFLSFLSEEAGTGSCNEGSDMEEGENVAETSDMEWEEGQEEHCIGMTKEFDDEPENEIVISDEEANSCSEEILGDDLLQELFCEESASCSLKCNGSDSEMEDVVQNWEILEKKSEECDSESDSGDSLSAATSVEETIVELEVADKKSEFEMNPQLEDDATDLLQSRITDSSETFNEIDKVETNGCQKFEETEADQSSGLVGTAEVPAEAQEQVPTQELDDELVSVKDSDHQLEDQSESTNVSVKDSHHQLEDTESTNGVENQDSMDKDEGANKCEISTISEDSKANTEQSSHMADGGNSGIRYQRGSRQEIADDFSNRKWTINSRKPINKSEEEDREFNPKEPNFLPVVPDPEAEKVDLKHQDIDDRKNSEEWMIDYALQQAVTKLAPARKRKVALLVEAFEKVLPIPRFDTRHIRNNTASAFSPRPIQACS